MSVEPGACVFAAGSVRRVDEEDGVTFILKPCEFRKCVAMYKFNAMGNVSNVGDSFSDGLRIPPRKDALPILTVFEKARTFRQNSAVRRPVLQDCLKSK